MKGSQRHTMWAALAMALVVALVTTSGVALAQAPDDNRRRCVDVEKPDTAIAACTALIEAGNDWGGARFPETAHCATDRKDGGRAWTEIMGWNRV